MKQSEASYTVEAALLSPIILAVVIALIQICFIFHDRVVIREALEYIAWIAEGKSGQEMLTEKATVYEYFKQDGVLLASEIVDYHLDESWRSVEVCAKLKSKLIVPFFSEDRVLVKEYSASKKRTYAEEKTIISEIALDTLHILE